MFAKAYLLGLYAETPLHPGSGSTVEMVDLPIQRERHTGFPVIPGTAIKGVLRDLAERRNPNKKAEIADVFGPEAGSGDLHGGALSITDARLLLFPVRSLEGVFVWVTCPLVLMRLERDLKSGKIQGLTLSPIQDGIKMGHAIRGKQSALIGSPLVLEEYDFQWLDGDDQQKTALDELATKLANLLPETPEYQPYRERLRTHLVIVSDEDFTHLVTTATEVVTRIKLNERKTTTGDGGNMWVEEFLPSDCVFYALALAMPPRSGNANSTIQEADGVLNFLRNDIRPDLIQIGGDETVGRGWMRVRIWEGKEGQS
jgi:CRISPR-associated protein Cmr4